MTENLVISENRMEKQRSTTSVGKKESTEEVKSSRVRRPKVGFEPYQVKKFHLKTNNIAPPLHKVRSSVNSGATQTGAIEDWDKEINENFKSMKSDNHNLTLENKPCGKKSRSHNKNKISEELRRKKQGIAILDCPCNVKDDLTHNAETVESIPDSIDDHTQCCKNDEKINSTKSLTVALTKTVQNSININSSDDDKVDNQQNNSPGKNLNSTQINEMFTNLKLNQPVYEISSDEDDKGNSNPVSDSESPVTTVHHKTSTGSNGKMDNGKQRQRSFMGSIVAILNENKAMSEQQNPEVKKNNTKVVNKKRTDVKRKKKERRKSLKRNNASKKCDAEICDKVLDVESGDKVLDVESGDKVLDVVESGDKVLDVETGDKVLDTESHKQKVEPCDTNHESLVELNKSENKVEETATKHVHFSEIEEPRKSSEQKRIIIEAQRELKEKQFQLKKLLEKGFHSMSSIKLVVQTSDAIQLKYSNLIIYYQDYAFKYDFESALWKTAFHNIILHFRDLLDQEGITRSIVQDIGKLYWDFLQNGIQFLDSLTLQLQEHVGFTLEHYLEDPVQMHTCTKKIKLGLRSCHLLLIFIGDLERYIALLQQEDNYRQAQLRYKQAQILAPKNGKSYNQQAVVAVVSKRKLDAVYFYTRSLQASNPILSAKDRLTAIFQEIKRKADVFHQSSEFAQPSSSLMPSTPKPNVAMKSGRGNSNDYLRHEVWIFCRAGKLFKVILTDDNRVVDLTTPAIVVDNDIQKVLQPDKFTLKKLNRSFLIHFLFVHCKLYTNVGLEELTPVHQEALSSLTTLLNYPKASSVKQENLLKCMAINIFAIHNIIEKQGHQEVIHGAALDLAIIFSMDMFSVISKQCVVMLTQKGNVDQLLPSVRVWLLWLVDHCDLILRSSACSMLDLWSNCCDLFNSLKTALPTEETSWADDDPSEATKSSYLIEDLFLAGFRPLRPSLLYCSSTIKKEAIMISKLRLDSLLDIIDEINTGSNLCIAFDEKESLYKVIQTTMLVSSSPEKRPKEIDIDSDVEEEDGLMENDDIIEDFEEMAQINELKLRKAALQKMLDEQEAQRAAAGAVISNHQKLGHHLSENCPSVVVADTNCYIDHLDKIIAILESKDFTLVAPLVVINELDGLKKGALMDNTKPQEHLQQVKYNARLAVDVLEDWFSKRDSNIRAITGNGTELSTIMFRAEELSNNRGTNDDVILSCCLHYCKEHITRTEDETTVVRRDVVLLTDDRNLRVKSHTRNVPTVNISTFMRMARFL